MLTITKSAIKVNDNFATRVTEFSTLQHPKMSLEVEPSAIRVIDYNEGWMAEVEQPYKETDAFAESIYYQCCCELTNSERTCLRDILRAAIKPDYTSKVVRGIANSHSMAVEDYDYGDEYASLVVSIGKYLIIKLEGEYISCSKQWNVYASIYTSAGMRPTKYSCIYGGRDIIFDEIESYVSDLPMSFQMHNAQAKCLKSIIETVFNDDFEVIDTSELITL